jgi:hypothetical protein
VGAGVGVGVASQERPTRSGRGADGGSRSHGACGRVGSAAEQRTPGPHGVLASVRTSTWDLGTFNHDLLAHAAIGPTEGISHGEARAWYRDRGPPLSRLVGVELVGVELVGVELVGVELVGVELVGVGQCLVAFDGAPATGKYLTYSTRPEHLRERVQARGRRGRPNCGVKRAELHDVAGKTAAQAAPTRIVPLARR